MNEFRVHRKKMLILPSIALALLLVGCGVEEETDTPVPTATVATVVTSKPEATRETVVMAEPPVPTVPSPKAFECLSFAGLPADSTPTQQVSLGLVREEFPVVPERIILTGAPSHIRAVLNHSVVLDLGLEPIGPALGLGPRFGPRIDGELPTAALYAHEDPGLAIRTVYEAVIELNEQGQEVTVLAGANRLVGNPWGIDADPWGIDADPWGIDADSWGFDTDPATGDPDEIRIPGESVESTWKQWALVGDTGIRLYDVTGIHPRRTVDTYGEGVDVFIFDTSPFETAGEKKVIGRTLCVYHPDLVIEIGATADPAEELGMRQHGYFASGLVRYVAPNSHLHLVRVLNEDGVGDVFSFLVVLQQLKDARGGMNGSVVNLSMSLHNFETEEQADEFMPTPEQQDRLIDLLPSAYHSYIENNDVIQPLELMMSDLHSDGAVIVAAAGNSSDLTAGDDFPPGSPAILPSTVGVAGSNIHRQRACFSNQPERPDGLMAPAGDGVGRPFSCKYPFPWLPETDSCPPSYPGGYDCEVAVTSVTTAGFAHWLGTSFSAPLVSGAAALMIGAGEGSCTAPGVTQWLQAQPGVFDVRDAVDAVPIVCP